MKVAIVGGATQALNEIGPKIQDPEWEIWGLNAIRPPWNPRWTRMFNLHLWAHLVRDWAHGVRADINWAQANPTIPFYVLDPWRPGTLPNERIFPREELSHLEFARNDYHAGSFDWLVAFAVLLGADEISLHGINLFNETGEPISARPCLEYWCGYAAGRGTRVSVASDCAALFAQYHYVRSNTVYGYDDVQLIEERKILR